MEVFYYRTQDGKCHSGSNIPEGASAISSLEYRRCHVATQSDMPKIEAARAQAVSELSALGLSSDVINLILR